MRYWMQPIHLRYEIGKRLDDVFRRLARRLPARLRVWVVVDSANTAIFDLHPRADGYAGPDGLTFSEIYDGAQRKVVCG